MRKRVGVGLAVLLVAVAGVVAWQLSREREPVYRGDRLSSWLKRGYGASLQVIIGTAANPPLASDAERQEADDAVRQAGTNAMPTLLRMLRASDSGLKVGLMNLQQRQRIITIDYSGADDLSKNSSKLIVRF